MLFFPKEGNYCDCISLYISYLVIMRKVDNFYRKVCSQQVFAPMSITLTFLLVEFLHFESRRVEFSFRT